MPESYKLSTQSNDLSFAIYWFNDSHLMPSRVTSFLRVCLIFPASQGRLPTETSDSEMASDMEPVKPSIPVQLKNLTVPAGQQAQLECVITGQPEPEVSGQGCNHWSAGTRGQSEPEVTGQGCNHWSAGARGQWAGLQSLVSRSQRSVGRSVITGQPEPEVSGQKCRSHGEDMGQWVICNV